MNFLYNGIVLPTLPERDLTKHKYALIIHVMLGGYRLFFCENLPKAISSTEFKIDAPAIAYYYASGSAQWERNESQDITSGSYTGFIENSGNSIGLLAWSNVDISDENGSVQFEASDPLPVGTITDPVSFMMGYQIGCRLRAQRGAKKPIGYSYNGVVLPELPEWDRETYPYVFIVKNTTNYYVQVRKLEPVVVTNTGYWPLAIGTGSALYELAEDGTTWNLLTEIKSSVAKPIWGNADVYYPDGTTLFLAASEPVPVYE